MHFNYTRICQVCISDKSWSTISESLTLISSIKKTKKQNKTKKTRTARNTWTIRNVFLQTFSRTYPCECALSSALIGHTFMTLWRHIQASRLLTRHHDFYLRLMPFLCYSNFIYLCCWWYRKQMRFWKKTWGVGVLLFHYTKIARAHFCLT